MFINYRKGARNRAIVFGSMLVCFGVFAVCGVQLLLMDDLLGNMTGIGLMSIVGVGVPWSILGLIFAILDYRELS